MYAVIFKTKRQVPMPEEYGELSKKLEEMALGQPGFVKIETVTDSSGNGITISYWETLDSIRQWKQNEIHLFAQNKGKTEWYKDYSLEICEIVRSYNKR